MFSKSITKQALKQKKSKINIKENNNEEGLSHQSKDTDSDLEPLKRDEERIIFLGLLISSILCGSFF